MDRTTIVCTARVCDRQVQKKTRISEQKNSIQSQRSENANNTGNANSKEVMKKNVRVLIKTTGFTDSYHKKVTLTSKSAFTVRIGKKTTQYPANAKVNFYQKRQSSFKKEDHHKSWWKCEALP